MEYVSTIFKKIIDKNQGNMICICNNVESFYMQKYIKIRRRKYIKFERIISHMTFFNISTIIWDEKNMRKIAIPIEIPILQFVIQQMNVVIS